MVVCPCSCDFARSLEYDSVSLICEVIVAQVVARHCDPEVFPVWVALHPGAPDTVSRFVFKVMALWLCLLRDSEATALVFVIL